MSKRDDAVFLEVAALLVKAPWWVGFAVAAAMFLGGIIIGNMSFGLLFPIEKIFGSLIKYVAIVPALCGLASFARQKLSGKLFDKVAGHESVNNLTWKEFEFLIGEYYRRKGYSVFQLGGDAPDGGIDLLAQKNGEKLVVQCKHWKAFKVDVKIARELYGVMVDSTASGAVLITSGSFTQPTMDFVKDKPIELVDGPRLAKLIAEVKTPAPKPAVPYVRRAVLIPTEPPPLIKEEKDLKFMPPAMRAEVETRGKAFAEVNPLCPSCKKPMVLRVAHKGPTPGSKFWGCANYPACRQTAPFA